MLPITGWVQWAIQIFTLSVVKTVSVCAVDNSRKWQESNPGPLGEKRKRHLFAKGPSFSKFDRKVERPY